MKRNLYSAVLLVEIIFFGIVWITIRAVKRLLFGKSVARYGHKF